MASLSPPSPPALSPQINEQLLLAYGGGASSSLSLDGLVALYTDGLGDLAADWATLALPEEEGRGRAAAKGAALSASSPARVVVTVSAGLAELVAGPGGRAEAGAAGGKEEEEEQGITPVQAAPAALPTPRCRIPADSAAGPPLDSAAAATPATGSPRGGPPSPASMMGKALVFTPVAAAGGGGGGERGTTPPAWRVVEGEEEDASMPPTTSPPAAASSPKAPSPSPPAAGPATAVPTMYDLEVAFREWKAMVGVDATPAPGVRPVLWVGRTSAAGSPAGPAGLPAVPEDSEAAPGAAGPVPPSPSPAAALDFLRLGRLLADRGDHTSSGAAAALGLSAIKAARPASAPGAAADAPGAPSPLDACDPESLLRLGNAVYEMGEHAAAEAAYAAGLAAAGEDVAVAADDGRTPGLAPPPPPPPAAPAWLPRALVPRSARRPRSRPFALPLIPRLRLNLGMSLEAQGDLAGARDQYAHAAASALGHPHALKLLGSVRYALGAPEPALAALDAALEAAPAYADAHCDRGVALCALSRAAEAVAAFEAALQADPAHASARFNLANVRRARGEWPAAVAAYASVLGAQPEHWKAGLGLSVSLIGAGRLEEAEAALGAALAAGAPADEVETELTRLKRLGAARRAGG